MKVKRKIIEIDEDLCNGCGECVPSCAEGALEIVNGKARMIAEKYCDGLGACLGECPTGALRIIERVADDFDEEAVEELLAGKTRQEKSAGCPSAKVQQFAMPIQAMGRISTPVEPSESLLTHWPVQIRLVPPTAPYLKGADLLIAADCTAVAHPHFQRDLLAGKVVMMGCPKFDDKDAYVAKFTDIFANSGLKSITVAIMEVPCCSNMLGIVGEAFKQSGSAIPASVIVIGARGHIVKEETLAVSS